MKKVLYDYLTDRFRKPDEIGFVSGPVITLSRDYGCRAKSVAQQLIERLAADKKSLKYNYKWLTINKEVLSDVARELELDPDFLNQIDTHNERNVFATLVFSFSRNYNVVDSKMQRILREVIQSYANRGSVVIVGRGGAVFAEDYENALHVRLTASKEWRSSNIQQSAGMPKKEADKMINEMDAKRKAFLSYLKGDDEVDDLFDITLNTETMGE